MSTWVTNWHSRLPGQARRTEGEVALGTELRTGEHALGEERLLRLVVRDRGSGRRLTVDLRGEDLDRFLADVGRAEVRLEERTTGKERR